MLNFTTPSLSMRQEINEIFYALPDPGCEYSFVNLHLWSSAQIAIEDGTLYILSNYAGSPGYFLPAGPDLETSVRRVAEDAAERGAVLSMFGVTERSKALLEARFPGAFSFYELRNGFDYVYDIRRLSELKGKKLQAKRNHIHRFEDACPDATLVPLTEQTLPLAREMAASWYEAHQAVHPTADFVSEQRALEMAFARFTDFGFEGLLLRDGARTVAFTMGSRIRDDVFDVHFEKAFADVPGAYAMINRSFARYLLERHPELNWLNREDDMGIEGLRKAKLSYYPDLLLHKWVTVSTPEAVLR